MTNEHADLIVTILDRIAVSLEHQTEIMDERNDLLKVNNALLEEQILFIKGPVKHGD